MPRACGESRPCASSSAVRSSVDTRAAAGLPAVDRWAASMASDRTTRKGSPARRASSRPRVWKSAPRIGSITLSPATADQHVSMRDRSSAETWLSSRVRNRYPRILSRARFRSSATRADCGDVGTRRPSGTRMVRRSASPSSTWPLMRSWLEASRFSSRVSAAVVRSAACR